ncbi:MAG: cobalamin-dependent protein, partial [Rhodothermales bacterium]|nr:cobalamin-dependent protein [Rhodothermales bacterium]
LRHLLDGDAVRARLLVLNAAEEGTPVRDLYVNVLQWAQHEVGRRWQANQISVAQEHLATAVTRQVMGGLTALAVPSESSGRTVVISCVATEQHDVGARMVADFFEMEGWRTYYLGADLPTPEILESVKRYRADVLGLSATLTPHLKLVREIITALRSTPETASVQVIVGGYPFNIDPDIWQQLGADGCASSAETAVRIAEDLVEVETRD